MADINFSLDEYIARKSITSPSASGSRGGRGGASRGGGGVARGAGGGGGGGANRGGARPSVTARLGSRQPPPIVKEPVVKPLMKIALDARDKLIEKARQGDARDKIIMKNRSKYKDAREKIGHPPQPPPVEEVQPHSHQLHFNGRNGSSHRPPIAGAERSPFPLHSHRDQRPLANHPSPTPDVFPGEDDLPRRRADARIIGRDNNIIVMAKNDFTSGDSEDPYFKQTHQPQLRHGNPVVMIRNDRVRNNPPPEEDSQSPPQRYRALAPQPKAAKMVSPRRGDIPVQRRQQPPAGVQQRKQPTMEQRLGAPNRDRSPINNGRLAVRQPLPHYDSASDGEQDPPPPEPRRKQIPNASKRSAPQTKEAPRPEKQPRRSPEPARISGRNSAPVPSKKSTSILHGIKPVSSSQIPKDTPPETGDKQSPLQGFRVLVSNLHTIVTQEDVVELFSACGALKRTKMIKPGVAEVVFVKREDAEMAVKKYNNRELDGQPMQCKMATPTVKPSPKIIEESLLGGRLKPAKQPGEGVEATTIHKALFNSNAAAAAAENSAKPVVFTVKI